MKTYQEFITEMTLGRAGVFADRAHKGQHRKGSGAPYITHPTAVVKVLQRMGVKDRDILVAAFLHDTIEDTAVTYNNIKVKFNKNVANLVKEVTSNKKAIDKYGKPEYLLRKLLKMSDNALLIKLADRFHNLEDINTVSTKFAEKMRVQTAFILNGLRKRSLTGPHKKLIRMIAKQIS